MDTTVAPIVISFLALVISAWGIVERRFALERDLRGRLLGIVDSLHELAVQEDDEVHQGLDENWDTLSAIAAQRMRLAQQALLLEQMIHGRHLTSEEYATIAAAFERAGDLDQALALWKRATKAAAGGSAAAEAANWRSTAGCFCQRGEYAEMRQAMARAVALIPTWHDRGRYECAMTYVDLAAGELAASRIATPELTEAISKGREMADRITSDDARAVVANRLAVIQSQVAAA